MYAVSICLLLLCLLIAVCEVESFHINKCSLSRHFVRKITSYSSSKDSVEKAGDAPIEDAVEKTGDVIVDNTMKKVNAGLTHIKYNKYAPTSEEAATMTDEEFRGTMMRRMKVAENERKKLGPVGSQVSDDYINSLSKKVVPP